MTYIMRMLELNTCMDVPTEKSLLAENGINVRGWSGSPQNIFQLLREHNTGSEFRLDKLAFEASVVARSAGSLRATLRQIWFEYTWWRVLQAAMGNHPRLGASSPLRLLNADTLFLVAEFVACV